MADGRFWATEVLHLDRNCLPNAQVGLALVGLGTRTHARTHTHTHTHTTVTRTMQHVVKICACSNSRHLTSLAVLVMHAHLQGVTVKSLDSRANNGSFMGHQFWMGHMVTLTEPQQNIPITNLGVNFHRLVLLVIKRNCGMITPVASSNFEAPLPDND